MILAMLAWYRVDRDPAWLDRIGKMVDGLNHIALRRGDYAYYPPVQIAKIDIFHYARTGWKSTEEPPTKDKTQWGNYALFTMGSTVRGLVDAWQETHDPKALDLAGRFVNFLTRPAAWEADNKAFLMKVEDTVRHSFNEDAFHQEVKLLEETTRNEIPTDKIEHSVKEVTKRFSLSDGEGQGILGHLVKGGDLTQYGLANAITAYAHDAMDYDRSVDFERMGGKIIDLSPTEWRAVSHG